MRQLKIAQEPDAVTAEKRTQTLQMLRDLPVPLPLHQGLKDIYSPRCFQYIVSVASQYVNQGLSLAELAQAGHSAALAYALRCIEFPTLQQDNGAWWVRQGILAAFPIYASANSLLHELAILRPLTIAVEANHYDEQEHYFFTIIHYLRSRFAEADCDPEPLATAAYTALANFLERPVQQTVSRPCGEKWSDFVLNAMYDAEQECRRGRREQKQRPDSA